MKGLMQLKSPVEVASYIVFTDGLRYYAKNGSTGMIEYSDTDASNVIQYAVNMLNGNGGKIFIKRGIYPISKTINISEPLIIEGEGPDWYQNHGTYLKSSGITVFNFDFGTSMKYMPIVRNLQIACPGGTGIRLGPYVSDPIVENVACHEGIGVLIDGAVNGWILNSWLETGNYGVRVVNGGAGFLIFGNHFYNNAYASISVEIYGVAQLKIISNIFENDKRYHIYFDGTGVIIALNQFRNPSMESAGGYDAIALSVRGMVHITNNSFTASQGRYAINVIGDNANARVMITDNIFTNTWTRPIALASGLRGIYIIRRNIGYLTENSGAATIPAGSTRVTVSHGLVATPTKFQITPLGQPPGKLWVENITSTSFDIVTDTAPTADLKVSWYAEV